MAEAPPIQRSLFAQIAARLVVLALAFALIDIAIVVPIYATDDQALAEDFVEQQAHRIDRAISSSPRSALAASELARLAAPVGVSAWGVVVIDDSLAPVARLNDAAPAVSAAFWPTRATLDWTRRESVGDGVRVTGLRRFTSGAGTYWILISADAVGRRLYWPVIGRELLQHVALPLIPLSLLLLIFNVQVVRRMLAPLSQAAAEVDALDPSRMETRLTPPAASREVEALVRAVNRALDRLQKAMTLLKTFTADAAHELRTPLSVLRLRIDALPDDAAKTRLGEEVQAMTRLVNQMLDLAQADALNLDDAEAIDLRGVASEVVTQLAPQAFAAGYDLRLVDEGAAPIQGHPEAIGRALRNLIENAIHHARGPIEVILGPGPQFAVRDHGEGLPPGDVEKIFGRFWRQDRAREGGAGLGLGIVRSIVEAHGGAISARSLPDGGTLFACSFPPRDDPASAPD